MSAENEAGPAELVLPGDRIAMEVCLGKPLALQKGQRFAIREGNLTIGQGVVSDILP